MRPSSSCPVEAASFSPSDRSACTKAGVRDDLSGLAVAVRASDGIPSKSMSSSYSSIRLLLSSLSFWLLFSFWLWLWLWLSLYEKGSSLYSYSYSYPPTPRPCPRPHLCLRSSPHPPLHHRHHRPPFGPPIGPPPSLHYDQANSDLNPGSDRDPDYSARLQRTAAVQRRRSVRVQLGLIDLGGRAGS